MSLGISDVQNADLSLFNVCPPGMVEASSCFNGSYLANGVMKCQKESQSRGVTECWLETN